MRFRSWLFLFVLSGCLWLPLLPLCFRPPPETHSELAGHLLRRQVALFSASRERSDLLRANPEWELMHRMFDVLAFANVALTQAGERDALLRIIDRITRDTIEIERERGQLHYLLPYARSAAFRDPAGHSLFVDGEIALMLAARQLVQKEPQARAELDARIARIVAQIERAPALLAESYPNEGWTFCNVVALTALRMHDALSGGDHRALTRRWIASARAHLLDASTGLLSSSFDGQGRPQQGPEGSTIWLCAAFLRLLDPDFAADQYRRAHHELKGQALGFAWAREWPASRPGHDDIDSGPTIPLVGANAGSSGLALVAASAFGDREFLQGLLTSLEFAGFPIEEGGERRYAAGNDLADAVVTYALVQGPLWQRVAEGEGRS